MVLGLGKTPAQIAAIAGRDRRRAARRCWSRAPRRGGVSTPCATRAGRHVPRRCAGASPCASRTSPPGTGTILVAAAGTSDLPVAEEAARTAELMGNDVDRLYDVGVAGLHRLLGERAPARSRARHHRRRRHGRRAAERRRRPGRRAGDRRADQRRLRRQLRRHRGAARHAEQLRVRRLGGQHRQRLRRRHYRLARSITCRIERSGRYRTCRVTDLRRAFQSRFCRSFYAMQPGALRALEFDRIVEAVRRLRADADGRRAPGAAAAVDRPAAGRAAAGGDDRDRPLSVGATALFPLRASSDLPQILAALAVEGRALEPLRLLALADLPRFGRRIARRHPPRAPAPSRCSTRASAGAASFKGEIAQTSATRSTRRATWSTTPARSCKAIRDRLRKQKPRLRGTLESYLRGKDTAKYLQDQVVTERNGRYVLVVKAEHRSAHSRASCTAARRAAPACFSSRSARSKSTTTSSRSRSRKPKKSAASCWR